MKRLILLSLLAIGLAQSSGAADLLWAPNDANWDLSSQNWTNTGTLLRTAFAQGDNVLFDDTGLAFSSIALGANLLSPSNMVVDTSSLYLIATASSGKLTNVASLTKRGSGTLILDADNVITNAITIEAGTLQLGNVAGRGAISVGSVTNNGILALNRTGTLNFSNNITGTGKLSILNTATATWNMRGTNTMTDYRIEHSGSNILYFTNSFSIGSPTNIQINVSSGNQRLQLGGGVTLPQTCPITVTVPFGDQFTRASLMSVAGTNTINGPIRIGGGSYGDPNSRPNVNLYGNTAAHLQVTVNSSVDDIPGNPFQGNFYLRGNSAAGINKMYGKITLSAAQLLKDEATTWTLYSTGNSATLTWIGNGRLNLGAANALPNAQLTVNATLDLGGFDQTVGPLYSAAGTTTGLITNSSATDALLTLSDGGAYDGKIADSGSTGKVGLKLLNPGVPHSQQLSAVCTYSGPTILQTATAIALVGVGSVPNTTPIQMANGSSIDASFKPGQTFTLGAAQTLQGDGTVHINGYFVNQGTVSLEVNKTGGAVVTDNLAVDNGYSLTYGGTLYLDLSGQALNNTDTLPLFTSIGGYSGTFASIVPSTPGPGLVWNTNTLTSDGVLRIAGPVTVTAALAAPGGAMSFSGSGGVPNGGFSVVSSTNVAAPLGTWIAVTNGSFDGSGSFNAAIPITSGEPQRFYRVRVP